MKGGKTLKKIFLTFPISLILLLSVLSPVSAEEYSVMPLWFEEDTYNLLTAEQQKYVCDNWDFVNSFDTIFIYTSDNYFLFGNFLENLNTGYTKFIELYWMNPDGTFLHDPAPWASVSDNGNVGAVYKSSGAFNLNVNNADVLNVCEVISAPSLDLPTPNAPDITSNVEQSTYISTISSPVVSGGVINYFRYDYFNIYAVNSTSYDNSLGGTSDLTIKYQQDSTGRYIIPIYDHSEVVIYGPNLTISTSGLQITPSLYNGVSYSFPNSNGVIQRDVKRFDYTYVDLQMLNQYPFENLPFSNANDNTGKVEYLGQQTSVRSGGTGSRSIMLEFNGKNYSTTFYIVITDTFKDIEQAKQESNQTIINNNINSNFTELDNTLQHGNALTQGSKNDLDIIDSQFNSSYDRYQAIEQGLIDEYNNNLDSIDLDTYKISNNLDLINTANFVRTQFDRLTLNNPIGLTIGFSLCVGLALLLIGKRL